MDDREFEKQAREMVSALLAELEKNPEFAADVARKLVAAGIKGPARSDPRAAVVGVCRGVLSAMNMLGKSVPDTAITLLKTMGSIAGDVNHDPQEMLLWGMQGVAAVCRQAGPETSERVESAIEEQFMGAGSAFHELLKSPEKTA